MSLFNGLQLLINLCFLVIVVLNLRLFKLLRTWLDLRLRDLRPAEWQKPFWICAYEIQKRIEEIEKTRGRHEHGPSPQVLRPASDILNAEIAGLLAAKEICLNEAKKL